MDIISNIEGNIGSEEWKRRLHSADIEYLWLDQWSAQKSRLIALGEQGREYAISLKRNSHLSDGDIIYYSENENRAVVIRIKLNDVMVVDMTQLQQLPFKQALRTAVELGHAIGNQHWPAIIKGSMLYIPLTVDKKVMTSVMDTHHIEGISYEFRSGEQIIPFLAPHEIRRLFGSVGQPSHSHKHCSDYE